MVKYTLSAIDKAGVEKKIITADLEYLDGCGYEDICMELIKFAVISKGFRTRDYQKVRLHRQGWKPKEDFLYKPRFIVNVKPCLGLYFFIKN